MYEEDFYKRVDELIGGKAYNFYRGTPYGKEVAIPEAIEGIKVLINEAFGHSNKSVELNNKFIDVLVNLKEIYNSRIEKYKEFPSTIDPDEFEYGGLSNNELALNSEKIACSFVEEIISKVK